ncbi:hypothetical protein VNO77_00539 [Canavalia gladiata]|uniref:Uncharacterized protein n=1 Tax=Canavalia gladiata TaxID=3824 RepID=A0AAN9MPK7_CANGL
MNKRFKEDHVRWRLVQLAHVALTEPFCKEEEEDEENKRGEIKLLHVLADPHEKDFSEWKRRRIDGFVSGFNQIGAVTVQHNAQDNMIYNSMEEEMARFSMVVKQFRLKNCLCAQSGGYYN